MLLNSEKMIKHAFRAEHDDLRITRSCWVPLERPARPAPSFPEATRPCGSCGTCGMGISMEYLLEYLWNIIYLVYISMNYRRPSLESWFLEGNHPLLWTQCRLVNCFDLPRHLQYPFLDIVKIYHLQRHVEAWQMTIHTTLPKERSFGFDAKIC